MRLKLFLIFLLIIGILASFYLPATIVKVSIAVYGSSASPYNYNWSGTSLLVDKLRAENISVIVTNSIGDLRREIERGGLILIVAPDKPLNGTPVDLIVDGFRRGLISLAVFDENVTSNNLLRFFGYLIDGRTLLDPYTRGEPYYPIAEIVDVNGSKHVVRLNWASIVKHGITSNISVREEVFCIGNGVLDYNDNGVLDDFETYTAYPKYTVGVIGEYVNSTLLIYSDSYPLLNAAITSNYTGSKIIIEYLVSIARSKGSRIIIPNIFYRSRNIGVKAPFHVGILFILVANFLKWLDSFIDSVIIANDFLNTLFILLTIISLSLFFRFLFRVGTYGSYEPSPIDEVVYLSEIPVTRLLITRRYVKGREKRLIISYWNIIHTIYSRSFGVDLVETISKGVKADYLASRLGIDQDKLLKELKWLYKVYLEASGRKRALPFISWRHRLTNYINKVEWLLNMSGYTITGRKGYRNVFYYIK